MYIVFSFTKYFKLNGSFDVLAFSCVFLKCFCVCVSLCVCIDVFVFACVSVCQRIIADNAFGCAAS